MDKKIVLLAFRGELMCFAHVLLYALDLKEKGCEVKVIFEGAATKLIPELAEPGKPFAELYARVKEAGLFDCVCKACAAKMGTLADAQSQNLTIRSEMMGHPGLSEYIEQGYTILTF